MKKILAVLACQLLLIGFLYAQTDSVAQQNDSINLLQEFDKEIPEPMEKVFIEADVMPEFPGGVNALRAYLSKTVRYPVLAAKNKEQGRVYVQFIVETDGAIEYTEIARGVSPLLNAEALRVVKSMPIWKPGQKDGRPVRVSYTMPINFKLQ